jgi:hypothetical protein
VPTDGGACSRLGFQLENERGSFFEESRGTVCECTKEGQVLSCSDASATCQSSFCNANDTICARTTDYGYTIDKDGTPVSWSSTFTYVSGREDVVMVEQSLVDFTCQVSVNGEPCRSCAPITCRGNGLESYVIVCDNVVGAGSAELCGGGHEEEGSAWTVFDLLIEEENSLGCSPRLTPVIRQ